VVLYELLTAGKLPFTANNQAALVLRIIRGVYEKPTGYSQRLLQTVDDCLQVLGRDYTGAVGGAARGGT
jgi:hypothetical protein